MEVVTFFDARASHAAGQGYGTGVKNLLKGLGERLKGESPLTVKEKLLSNSNLIENRIKESEGLPAMVVESEGTVSLKVTGRRDIILWSEGSALGGFLKWNHESVDNVLEGFDI
jgi:hypothetical protein